MPKKKISVNDILKLSKQGYTDADIIRYLREEGYTPTEINDAMNQAKIKMELAETAGMESEVYAPSPYESAETAEEEMTPSIMSQQEQPEEAYYAPAQAAPAAVSAPESEGYPYAYPSTYEPASTESMEELAEEIIREKWEEFTKKAGDIIEFKRYIESRIKSLDERIKRLERSFDKLQSATLGKMQEYGRDVKSLGTEIQALEGAFGKVVKPLTGSVKELRELSEEMRKLKKIAKAKPVKPKIAKAKTIKRKRK